MYVGMVTGTDWSELIQQPVVERAKQTTLAEHIEYLLQRMNQ